MVRKTKVISTTMDLELGAQELLGHRRALDVPSGPTRPPRRLPRHILVWLLRLPEREVTLIALQVARFLRDHVLEPRAGEPSVLREARDAEVHVAVRDIRFLSIDELLNEPQDLGDRLGRAGLDVGASKPEGIRVLEEPCRGALRQLPARNALLHGLGIHLVVDVRDVVYERDLVTPAKEPAPKPHPEHERPRVADVDPLVDGGAADVDPDRPGWRRQLDEPAGLAVVETHRAMVLRPTEPGSRAREPHLEAPRPARTRARALSPRR